MTPFSARLPRPLFLFFALLLTSMTSVQAWAAAAVGSQTVVISQIYGGGGNTSASYDSDFVELFNLSSSPVNITGWSIQYISASSTSTATQITTIGTAILQPGQFYLIKEAAGGTCKTSGTTAPTTCPTFTGDNAAQGTINLSGTVGKVFLVNSSTTITEASVAANGPVTTCPATPPPGGAIIDYVGYGSTASCSEGANDMMALTGNAQSAIRTKPCVDTDNNGNDFSVSTTVVPRSSSTTPAPCTVGPPTNPSISVAVSPNSQNSGSSVLLTATLTAGTNPTSTGVAVTVDLSGLGGNPAQALNDNGTNGDVKSGDGIYSYSYTIPSSQATNTYTLNFSVTDGQSRSGMASTNLSVTKPVPAVAIDVIQGSMGNGMTAPTGSSYVGQVLQISGIITGITANGFYVQTPDSAIDGDLSTPEGIFVRTSSTPNGAVVGASVQLQGTVMLYPAGATLAGTELDGISAFTVITPKVTLPAPITLSSSSPSQTGGGPSTTGGPYQLMRYQSMRVTVPSFTATEPTQGILNETAETYTSNGIFYGTVTGVARPVREAGLEVLDPLSASYPAIAKFDDNPEVFAVDSLDTSGSPGAIDVSTGAVLTNMTGVMDYSGILYSTSTNTTTVGNGPQMGAGPVFMIDAATRPTVTAGVTAAAAVGAANAGELVLATQSLQRLYNATADNAPNTTGEVVVTSAAYALRLAKASLAIRNVLGTPDVLAVQEVENLQTLNDLSAKISADASANSQTDPGYVAYLTAGNDPNALNVGFLVNPSKVDVLNVVQSGKSTTYTNTGGSAVPLFEHPPLVMHLGVKRAIPAEYLLTVIVNHLLPLTGETANTTAASDIRNRRAAQASALASLIQGFQANKEHVISVGDYNAYDVNDGVVDSMDTIRGVAVAASADIVAGPTTPLVTPALVDAAPTSLSANAYTYINLGSAESLDHFLVTSDIAASTRTAPAHFNVDFPAIYRNDTTRPEVSADHDGIVGYIAIPPGTFISVTPASLTYTAGQPLNTPSASQPVTVKNTGTVTILFTSITPSAGFTQTNTCGASLAAGATCTINVVFQPVVTGPTQGTLTLSDSDQTGTQTVSLSGTGLAIYSTIQLSVTPSFALVGANVQLMATLGGNSTKPPTGAVTFFDNGAAIGTVNPVNGVATLNIKTLGVGSHPITASSAADAVYPSATTGAAVTVTIATAPFPDFSFSISNTAINVSSSLPSGSTTLNVAMLNGFNQTVSFSCSGLPSSARCNFAPPALSASGTSTLTVVVTTAALTPGSLDPMERNSGIVLALGLLGLPLLRRRALRIKLRSGGVLLGLLLLGVAMAITGCGNGTSSNLSTTTVVVTATGGGISHTASFTLQVQ